MVVSILIVNWNSKDYLRKCLASVRCVCNDCAPQIIVVDNASFDGAAAMLAREFPEAECIQSNTNLGFARANNLAFSRARGGYVLLLNPDTELLPGSVTALISCLENDGSAGLAAPRLLNPDGSIQKTCVRSLPTPLNRALESDLLDRFRRRIRRQGRAKTFDALEPIEVEAVSGACMLLRSSTFRRVGGFTEDFFMYGEDMDLCAKIRNLGLKVLHVPSARVIHHGGGASAKQPGEFSVVMLRVASETYMRLHHGAFAALKYRTLQAIVGLVRMAWALMQWCLCPTSRRGEASACFRKGWFVLRWALRLSKYRSPATMKRSGSLPECKELTASP